MESKRAILELNERLQLKVEQLLSKLREHSTPVVGYVGVTNFPRDEEWFSNGVYILSDHEFALYISVGENGVPTISGPDTLWDFMERQLKNNISLTEIVVDPPYSVGEIEASWLIMEGTYVEFLETILVEHGHILEK